MKTAVKTTSVVVLCLICVACATPAKVPIADPYRKLRGAYPDLYNIVGIGEAKLTGNQQANRQAAEILAKAEIARQIRVTVKEQILDIVRSGGSEGVKDVDEFTRIAESRAEETLEGVKIVEGGENPDRGVVYAVAVLPREEAIARMTSRATLAYEQAATLIRRADEAKRAGDAGGSRRLLTEARQAVLNGMALEGERTVIAGSLKDLPGTIPPIAGRPDLAAIEAALPPPTAPLAAPQAPAPPTAPPAPTLPSQPVWVTATGEAPFGLDTTLGKARDEALQNARRNALESAVGTFLRGSTTVYNYQVAEDLVNATVRGIIEQEEIVDEGQESVKQSGAAGRQKSLIYHLTLKAKVRPVPVERHGDYRLVANLNRTVFKNGDEARISVKTNEDSYLYLFTVTQDESVLVLLPNSLIPINTVSAGTDYLFPPEELRLRGIKLRVSAPPGTTRATEKIKVIAAKKKLVFMKKKFQEAVSVFSDFKGKETGLMTDLLKELSLLGEPGADWTEATLPYEVEE